MRILAFAVACAMAVSSVSCAPRYVIGGTEVGHLKASYAVFKNGNSPESDVTYRVFIDDPESRYTVATIAPGEKTPVLRVPAGRVYIRYEIYKYAQYQRTRSDFILVKPVMRDGPRVFTFEEREYRRFRSTATHVK